MNLAVGYCLGFLSNATSSKPLHLSNGLDPQLSNLELLHFVGHPTTRFVCDLLYTLPTASPSSLQVTQSLDKLQDVVYIQRIQSRPLVELAVQMQNQLLADTYPVLPFDILFARGLHKLFDGFRSLKSFVLSSFVLFVV